MHMDITLINHILLKGRTQRRQGHPQLRGTEALMNTEEQSYDSQRSDGTENGKEM